ncbi:nuclear transport factor 2 family protein [Pseudorhodoferax sp.]|uniref:nuclear transport factor 2 family protein n=1 Tax=Pseudorhodoferax sp. TaxID=1993553 RepID=UPI0039E3D88E
MEEERIHEFFERYRDRFRQGLHNAADLDDVASAYASAFVAASPAGVMAGRNDEPLKQAMREGFERYRRIGTKDMDLRGVRIHPIDEHHCLAHVAWTATYDRGAAPDVAIDFDVHYLVQLHDGEPRIFGWVSGDEQALLRQHGIL